MELFSENSSRLKSINYFGKKIPSQMFDWVLNTPLQNLIFSLYRSISSYTSMIFSTLLNMNMRNIANGNLLNSTEGNNKYCLNYIKNCIFKKILQVVIVLNPRKCHYSVINNDISLDLATCHYCEKATQYIDRSSFNAQGKKLLKSANQNRKVMIRPFFILNEMNVQLLAYR